MKTIFDKISDKMEEEINDKRSQQKNCGKRTFEILNAYMQGVQTGQRIVEEYGKPQKMHYGDDNGRQRKCCSWCGCFVLPGANYCSKCGQGCDWD